MNIGDSLCPYIIPIHMSTFEDIHMYTLTDYIFYILSICLTCVVTAHICGLYTYIL